jgi:hypothetical protein
MSNASNISPFTHHPKIKIRGQGEKKGKECTYNLTLRRVRVMVVPAWLLLKPEAIPLEDSASMAI